MRKSALYSISADLLKRIFNSADIMENNNFRMGLRDGIPIALGYLAVSFAFGISSAMMGLSAIEALLISLLNLTSAGQLAGMPIIAGGGSLIELALTQLVINSRYALMSVSLSQRLSPSITSLDRAAIGFAVTDEIFATAYGKEQTLGRKYLVGLAIFPIVGWTLGTLLGAIAGDILPDVVVNALSVAMYAMFIAIIVPAAKKSVPILLAVLLAVAISSVFYYVPALSAVPAGFVIIIAAVVSGIVIALAAPVKDDSEEVAE